MQSRGMPVGMQGQRPLLNGKAAAAAAAVQQKQQQAKMIGLQRGMQAVQQQQQQQKMMMMNAAQRGMGAVAGRPMAGVRNPPMAGRPIAPVPAQNGNAWAAVMQARLGPRTQTPTAGFGAQAAFNV